MRQISIEEQLRGLDIDPERPNALLAFPLAAICTVDGPLSAREEGRIVDFCRADLSFNNTEDRLVRKWLGQSVEKDELEQALVCLRVLRASSDAISIENKTLTHVLLEAVAFLRQSGDAEARPLGRQLLQRVTHVLDLDLGVPWDEVAPELLADESEAESAARKSRPARRSGEPVRRLRSSRRLDEPFGESGGLV
jgi:hypothetical protein